MPMKVTIVAGDNASSSSGSLKIEEDLWDDKPIVSGGGVWSDDEREITEGEGKSSFLCPSFPPLFSPPTQLYRFRIRE